MIPVPRADGFDAFLVTPYRPRRRMPIRHWRRPTVGEHLDRPGLFAAALVAAALVGSGVGGWALGRWLSL